MRYKHLAIATLGLLVSLLTFLLWGPEHDSPAPPSIPQPGLEPAPLTTPEVSRSSERRPVYEEECHNCPSAPGEALKRDRPEASPVQAVDVRDMLDTNRCYGRLLLAAMDGVPDPDTSDLGGCDDRTPLHVADTPEQVQALIEAGVDVNAQDEYGNTALHRQSFPTFPTEDSLTIIDLLLEADADPTLKNERGEAPWKTALLFSHTRSLHLFLQNKVAENAEAGGLTVPAYLALNPHYRDRLDGLMDAYLIESKIHRKLLAAGAAKSAVAYKQ